MLEAMHHAGSISKGPTDRAAARPMGMGAGLSGERATAVAAQEAAERALSELGLSLGATPITIEQRAGAQRREDEGASSSAAGGSVSATGDVDLAIVAISPHHVPSVGEALDAIGRVLSPRNIMLVSAEAVLGGFLELEGVPGISVMAASLPGVGIHAFSSDDLPLTLGVDEEADAKGDLAEIAMAAGITGQHRCTILAADPFSVPITGILPVLSRARSLCSPEGAGRSGGTSGQDDVTRRGPIVGGVASAAMRSGGNVLAVNGKVRRQGLVGVSLSGPIRADAVVSQGCRAIGPNMIVTSAKSNVILSLGGRPALTVIREQIDLLPEEHRQLLSRGLMLGRVVDEYRDRFGPGDYLIRAVTKVSPEDNAIMVADQFRVGQTVRLHLRDAQTAERDLAMLMDMQALDQRPVGGLLITCNGRGTRLFSKPNHDVTAIQRAFFDTSGPEQDQAGEQRAKGGKIIRPVMGFPLSGYFAAGEIGPVGDGVFLHGHTACAVLFRRV
jgi:small ligand-binding sensory domain FIST